MCRDHMVGGPWCRDRVVVTGVVGGGGRAEALGDVTVLL